VGEGGVRVEVGRRVFASQKCATEHTSTPRHPSLTEFG
jgi:hypothetical protein